MASDRYHYLANFYSVHQQVHCQVFDGSKQDAATYLERIESCLEGDRKVTTTNHHAIKRNLLAFDLFKDQLVKILFDSSREDFANNPTNPVSNLSLLHIACIANDKPAVEKLLNNGVDINIPVMRSLSWYRKSNEREIFYAVRWRANSTPMHLAVIFENSEIVDLLLENGADIYAKDTFGFTPIHLAMASPELDKTIALRLLSTENLKESITDEGLSHLHVAAYANNANAAKKLLECGDVNVNSRIEFYVPAVPADPFAGRNYVTPCIPNWQSEYSSLARFTGLTPLHLAVRYSSIDIVNVLLAGDANIFLEDELGVSSVYYIVCINPSCRRNASSMEDFAKFLKSKDFGAGPLDHSGLTMLHVACGLVDEELARDLLKRGADVNAQICKNNNTRWKNCTPLHILMLRDRNDYKVKPSKFKSMVQLLLKHGADVTISEGFTPILAWFNNFNGWNRIDYIEEAADLMLRSQKSYDINPASACRSHFHYACARNAVDVVQKFLEHGVDVNFIPDPSTKYGSQSPLHMATAHGSEEVIRLLIKYGADVNIRDKNDATILHYACERAATISFDLIAFILSAGVDINAKDRENRTAWDLFIFYSPKVAAKEVKIFLQNGAKMKFVSPTRDSGEYGILGSALRMGPADQQLIFKSVLDAYNTSNLDDGGCNAIHSVVLCTWLNGFSIEYFTAVLERLIEDGCDLNQQNIHGRTPLHLAKSTIAMHALLRLGADVNIMSDRRSSISLFGFNYSHECHKVLFEHTSKMVTAGLTLHVETERERLLSHRCFTIDGELERRWVAELERMKNTQISRFLTMRHFLYESGAVAEYPLLPESRRRFIDALFSSRQKIYEYFPEYAGLLLCQHRKAVARVNLIEPAINALSALSGFYLPEPCSHAILKFLGNVDLVFLIETQQNENLKESVKMEFY